MKHTRKYHCVKNTNWELLVYNCIISMHFHQKLQGLLLSVCFSFVTFGLSIWQSDMFPSKNRSPDLCFFSCQLLFLTLYLCNGLCRGAEGGNSFSVLHTQTFVEEINRDVCLLKQCKLVYKLNVLN